MTLSPSMFLTRKETAQYLRLKDEQSVDARLTKSETFVPGKLRYRLLQDGGKRRRVRGIQGRCGGNVTTV